MNYRTLIIVAAMGIGLVGCVSRSDIQREIRSARLQALHQWQQRQSSDDENEPQVDGQLSLEDALKLALTHNKQLQAITQDRDIARGRVLSSHSGLLPTISLLSSYTRHADDAQNKRYIGSSNEYSTDIKVTQPLFRGGATQAELRSAQFLACYSNERIRQQVETTLYHVTSNYYHALLAQQLLKVAQDAVTSAEAHLNEVTRKQDTGAATEYSVLRARVDVALYQAEMIRQRNALHLATTQLLKEMGAQQDSHIELSGALVYRSVQPVFEQAVQAAYRNRPDLGQAQVNVRIGEEAIRLAASRYWPQISVFATGGWGRPDPYQNMWDEWDSHASAGICMELPLFDGLRREGQMIETKAMLRKRQFELFDTEEQVVLEIRQALLSLRDTEEFVESQRMNLKLAEEGLRLAEVGYINGVNTEVDVTDARSALTRAQGFHYEAIHDHAIARLMLQKATGLLAVANAPSKENVFSETPDHSNGVRKGEITRPDTSSRRVDASLSEKDHTTGFIREGD